MLSCSLAAWADWPDLSKPPAAVGGGEKDAALVIRTADANDLAFRLASCR